jgi:hypothetical protein
MNQTLVNIFSDIPRLGDYVFVNGRTGERLKALSRTNQKVAGSSPASRAPKISSSFLEEYPRSKRLKKKEIS